MSHRRDDDLVDVVLGNGKPHPRAAAPWAEHQRGDADERDYTSKDAPADTPQSRPSASGTGKPRQEAVSFDPIDSAAFAAASYPREWLIRRVLVRGQPCVIGGGRKGMKTSVVVDLALSLGTGTPFLGEFDARPCRVLVLSGESGEPTIQETARRVCAVKGIDLDRADVFWEFTLPQFGSPEHIDALCETIRRLRIDVVVVDPLYLCLLAGVGAEGLSAANLYQTGPLLMTFGRACLAAGATPVLVHHTTKGTRPSADTVPQLEDLAYAGIAEYARQWLLLSRREVYDPSSGVHRLFLAAGGSAGHGGLWHLDVDEGVLDDEFQGRQWSVTVTGATEARQGERAAKDAAADAKTAERDRRDDEAVLAAVAKLSGGSPQWVGYTPSRAESRLNTDRMTRAVNRLVEAGSVEETTGKVVAGKGAKVSARLLRLTAPPSSGSSGQHHRD